MVSGTCSIQPTVRLTYIKKSGGGMWGKGACSKAWVLKLFFRIEMSRKLFCLPGGSEAIFGNFIHYGNWNNYNFSVGGGRGGGVWRSTQLPSIDAIRSTADQWLWNKREAVETFDVLTCRWQRPRIIDINRYFYFLWMPRWRHCITPTN